jgi:8-oxo-dGTP diphosphatase
LTAVGTIKIVAALIRDHDGRVLLVRKRGTKAFMQPGGNPASPPDIHLAPLTRDHVLPLASQG